MYFTTYNRDMGEITMEPAYRGIEEETVTRLPSKAFDEFLKALDRPVPQTARVFLVKSVFRVSSLIFFGFRHEECRPVVCFTGCPSCRT